MTITPVDIEPVTTEQGTVRVSMHSQVSRAHAAGDVVQWFLDYFWIRHPISNTAMDAYRADLVALDRWLAVFRRSTLLAASEQDLRAFLAGRHRPEGQQAGSTPSLSCIRRFYFYLVEVGLRTDDPTEHVYVRVMPQLAKQGLTLVQDKRS